MKSSRFSQEQIIGILKQGEAGVKVTDLCRQHGISDHTLRLRSGQVYYRWKSKFGGMEVSKAKRLQSLEEENRQRKQLLAERVGLQQTWKTHRQCFHWGFQWTPPSGMSE